MRRFNSLLLAVVLLLVPLALIARAGVLDNWTTNQICTNFFALHHVVYGDNRYVAVGEYEDGGEIYSSEDGLTWTSRFSDNNSWGLTLNYSGGHFAGVGGFGIADVSADGINWTSSFLPAWDETEEGQAVTYGNNLYVTVGEYHGTGSIQTSPTGSTWTSRSVTGGVGANIADVAYGAARFVAIGNNDGYAYTSTGFSAGINWTKGSIAGGNKISFANGLFIVPLNNKTNLLSIDGTSWSPQPTGLTNQIGKVNFGNGVYMTQCFISYTNSYLATSIDGTNWTRYPKALPNFGSYVLDLLDPDVSLATDGSRLVTVGAMTTGIFSYNSFIYISGVLVGIDTTNSPLRQVVLSGLVGRKYQIQFRDALSGSAQDWRTNVTLQLSDFQYSWTDSGMASARFYRGVLLP